MSGETQALGLPGRATGGLAVWMAAWWITEALPIAATALLPIAILPLVGAASVGEATAPYAHPLIFLFMGGFVLSLAVQRWGLHERAALLALHWIGGGPSRVVAGFMAVTAAFSMWVSNTATALMMLPIATSVVEQVERAFARESDATPPRAFALCLLLGIAYAASIGGIGTLIGTPPNLVLASFVESQLGRPIGFAEWMAIGLPVVFLFLPVAWWVLTRVVYPLRLARLPESGGLIRDALRRLGPVTPGERATALVFACTAAAWVLRPWLIALELGGARPLRSLSDTGIAILAALALFLVRVRGAPGRREQGREPAGRLPLMDWATARELPWGLLILFGGGLSLARAIQESGVGDWLGAQVGGLAGAPLVIVIAVVTALVIFLTEVTSNTATTAALLPILAGLAPGLGLDPLLLLLPAALAASCAFMLPVATPPNAVVFGSGRIRIPEMCRAGLWLNVVGIVLIPLITLLLAVPLLGPSP